MYFKSSELEEKISYSNSEMLAVVISVALIIILGLVPGSFIDLITSFL
jgi:NADH:ubiquinone oxidoreductase subunit 4 (subunit M)